MIRFSLLAIAFGLTSAAWVTAQPPGNGRGGESAVERMMSHDANKDGKLSKDEVPERLQRLFARADANEDGVLSREEVQKELGSRDGERRDGGPRDEGRRRDGDGPPPERRDGDGPPPEHRDGDRGRWDGPPPEGRGRGGRGFGPPPNLLFEAIDANGDEQITEEELKNAVAALKKLDQNKDGRIDMEEVRPPRPDFEGRGRGFGPPGEGRGGRDGQGPPPEGRRDGERGRDGDRGRGRDGGDGARRPPIEE